MKSKSYIILGDPIPLARPRMGNGRIWDSQKHTKFAFGVQLVNQHGSLPMFDGPLHLDITFYFSYPKMSKKKREELLHNYHVYVPDLSNLIKLIEDVGTEAGLYKDDRLISKITSKKEYADTARVEFTITELI